MRNDPLEYAIVVLIASACAAQAEQTGAIQGTVTTLGGTPLNGVCGKLYNKAATKELVDFAGSGTNGVAGAYNQSNVKPGTYKLLFINCGANTNGEGPDWNYTPIFLGSTWDLKKANTVVVQANITTNLPPQPIPYGGSIVGTIIDKTTKKGADTPVFAAVPPGGKKFFLRFAWMLNCANADGTYDTNTGFQQGVPDGSVVHFAPAGWGCLNSQGVNNTGFFVPAKSKPVSIIQGSAVTVNGAVKEAGP